MERLQINQIYNRFGQYKSDKNKRMIKLAGSLHAIGYVLQKDKNSIEEHVE
jgi:hypothetical protein